jgi:Na+/proline symporter
MMRFPMTIDKSIAWIPLVAVAASATIFTTMQGLTYPLLALRLDHMAVSTWLIGVNAAITPAGMIVAAVAAPSLIPRIGSYALMMSSLLGATLALLPPIHGSINWRLKNREAAFSDFIRRFCR